MATGRARLRPARLWLMVVVCVALTGCGLLKKAGAPESQAAAEAVPVVGPPAPETTVAGTDDDSAESKPVPSTTLTRKKSRWIPTEWHELPGFGNDSPGMAWDSWINACAKPPIEFVRLCRQIRQHRDAPDLERLQWMKANLQPYRVESMHGRSAGLLTGYFEPTLDARRRRDLVYRFPVYQPPHGMHPRKRWYSRREMDAVPVARRALKGREIAWLSSPVEVLLLQIQGTAMLNITEPDGTVSVSRLRFTATNRNPAASAGQWLLQRGAIANTGWEALQEWADNNPARGHELLWANPQVVFFKEQPVADHEVALGPYGAHGVQLTARRSIAVDRDSIPFGAPVWMTSSGAAVALNKLVFAQDTGGSIQGAVRADFYTGSGKEAGELASRIRQPLRLWVLWPKPKLATVSAPVSIAKPEVGPKPLPSANEPVAISLTVNKAEPAD